MIKQAAKSAILNLGISRLAQSVIRPSVVLLRYHSVREKPEELDPYISVGITHSAAVFRRQMEYVSSTCTPVTLDDLPAFVDGSRAIPKRAVIVTFDDGFRDNYEIAAPILEKCGLRGVFYLPTSAIEGRPLWIVRLRYWRIKASQTREQFLAASRMCASSIEPEREQFLAGLKHTQSVSDNFTMTWAQARELVKRGHAIGSHTVNHPNLTKIPGAELKEELQSSKKVLESNLGSPVHHFSYPNPILEPHWDETTIEACRLAEYQTAVTSTDGRVTAGTNAFAVPRLHIDGAFSQFTWDLEMAFCGSAR